MPGPPKRFAQGIGAVFTVGAVVLAYGFDQVTAAYVVIGVLMVAAGLEAAVGFCLGCKVFALLMQGRDRPRDRVRALQRHLGGAPAPRRRRPLSRPPPVDGRLPRAVAPAVLDGEVVEALHQVGVEGEVERREAGVELLGPARADDR